MDAPALLPLSVENAVACAIGGGKDGRDSFDAVFACCGRLYLTHTSSENGPELIPTGSKPVNAWSCHSNSSLLAYCHRPEQVALSVPDQTDIFLYDIEKDADVGTLKVSCGSGGVRALCFINESLVGVLLENELVLIEITTGQESGKTPLKHVNASRLLSRQFHNANSAPLLLSIGSSSVEAWSLEKDANRLVLAPAGDANFASATSFDILVNVLKSQMPMNEALKPYHDTSRFAVVSADLAGTAGIACVLQSGQLVVVTSRGDVQTFLAQEGAASLAIACVDESRLLVATKDGAVQEYNYSRAKDCWNVGQILPIRIPSTITHLSTVPESSSLLVASGAGAIFCVDTNASDASAAVSSLFHGVSSPITSFALTQQPDGQVQLATSSGDGIVSLKAVDGSRAPARLHLETVGGNRNTTCLAFGEVGPCLLAGYPNGVVALSSFLSASESTLAGSEASSRTAMVYRERFHAASVDAVALSATAALIASASHDTLVMTQLRRPVASASKTIGLRLPGPVTSLGFHLSPDRSSETLMVKCRLPPESSDDGTNVQALVLVQYGLTGHAGATLRSVTSCKLDSTATPLFLVDSSQLVISQSGKAELVDVSNQDCGAPELASTLVWKSVADTEVLPVESVAWQLTAIDTTKAACFDLGQLAPVMLVVRPALWTGMVGVLHVDGSGSLARCCMGSQLKFDILTTVQPPASTIPFNAMMSLSMRHMALRFSRDQAILVSASAEDDSLAHDGKSFVAAVFSNVRDLSSGGPGENPTVEAAVARSGAGTQAGDAALTSPTFVPQTDEQRRLVQELEELRQELHTLLKENEQKDDLERLGREEFVLDLQSWEATNKDTEAAVRQKRDDIEYQILEERYKRSKLLEQCWHSMETIGRTMNGLEDTTELHNFPLRRQTQHERDLVEHAAKVRATEVIVEDAVALVEGTNLDGAETQPFEEEAGASSDASAPVGGGQENGSEHDSRDLAQAERMLLESTEDRDADRLLYTTDQLIGSDRRRRQILLLEDRILRIKRSFNTRFDELVKDKTDEIRKVEEKNARVQAICKELGQEYQAFVPLQHPLQKPESLLQVKDEEIKVERVLTAEEQAAEEERQRKLAELRAQQEQDNPRKRGVQDMMGGRLEDNSEEDIWVDPEPPEFMKEVPKSEWTDELKQAAEDYSDQLKELEEARDKRRKALDAERRQLQKQIEKIVEHFDARLLALHHLKVNAELLIRREELSIRILAKCEQDLEMSRLLEQRASNELEHLAGCRPPLKHVFDAAAAAMNKTKTEHSSLMARERQLEKTLKAKSELVESPFWSQLLAIFKRRQSSTGEPLSPAEVQQQKPESIPDDLWHKFVELRHQKLENDLHLISKSQQLLQASELASKRKQQLDVLDARMEKLRETMQFCRDSRALVEAEMPRILTLRQGRVEPALEPDYDVDTSDCLLLDTSLLDSINDKIRSLGNAKVDHLTKKAEQSKGLRQFMWESQLHALEADELSNQIKEVQMFRVTKKVLHNSKTADEEVQSLERSKQSSERTHDKAIRERKKQAAKLKAEIDKFQSKNSDMDSTLPSMTRDVQQRANVRKAQLASVGDGGAQVKLARAQQRRQLMELVQRQDEELASLRQELTRLRMRTFPAFPPLQGGTRRF